LVFHQACLLVAWQHQDFWEVSCPHDLDPHQGSHLPLTRLNRPRVWVDRVCECPDSPLKDIQGVIPRVLQGDLLVDPGGLPISCPMWKDKVMLKWRLKIKMGDPDRVQDVVGPRVQDVVGPLGALMIGIETIEGIPEVAEVFVMDLQVVLIATEGLPTEEDARKMAFNQGLQGWQDSSQVTMTEMIVILEV